jgi:hypothetical protein
MSRAIVYQFRRSRGDSVGASATAGLYEQGLPDPIVLDADDEAQAEPLDATTRFVEIYPAQGATRFRLGFTEAAALGVLADDAEGDRRITTGVDGPVLLHIPAGQQAHLGYIEADAPLALPVQAAVAPGLVTTTIASGQSLSPSIDLGDGRAFALLMPAAWDAAAVTFQISPDGTTWYSYFDAAAGEISIPATSIAAASRAIVLDPRHFFGVRHLKIRSGIVAAAVNQTAARVVGVLRVPR